MEFVHFGFVVKDLSATYRRLMDLGAHIGSDDIDERRASVASPLEAGSDEESTMQNFELTDQAGQARRLTDALQDGTVVVISYYGDWVVIPSTWWCSMERSSRLDAISRW